MMKKRAFTLAELLIIVLIIGAMTVIAIPRMSFSIISGGKAQATAQTLAAAIRHTRSLAIANAATNTQGFSLNMTSSSSAVIRFTGSLALTSAATSAQDLRSKRKRLSYSGFQIVNLQTSAVSETGSIDAGVSCTGDRQFSFGPYGNRTSGTGSLTVSAGGKTYTVTVVPSTGMVKCEQQ